MEVNDADRIDLDDILDIETGASGIRVTWKNLDREYVDGGAAQRLLERWKAKVKEPSDETGSTRR
jgi:hypothetical protein